MNLMLVAVAFASLSAIPADQAPSGVSENESGRARNEAPASPSTANNQTAASERPVCRRIVVSGSNRSRRVCMTAEQWRQQGE